MKATRIRNSVCVPYARFGHSTKLTFTIYINSTLEYYLCMNREIYIQGFLTTEQASELSGMTAHRIACLARANEIDAVKIGNTLLVDAASLQRYSQNSQGNGRPLSAKTAYAALWLLSKIDADWLSYQQRRRLDIFLETTSVEKLCWQCRKRATRYVFRVSKSYEKKLESSLLLTSKNSRAVSSLGLVGSFEGVEGYCHSSQLLSLEKRYHLQPDNQGNAVIYSASWLPENIEGEMPIAVIAMDLAQSLNTRERSIGKKKLKELLDEYRAS